MENKEKYYTPEETEFSIGFEYEEKRGEKWYKRKYDTSDFLDYDQNFVFEKSRVRVKYIDSEDLKELGFEIYPTLYTSVYKKDDILISLSWNMKKIQISRIVMTQSDDFECSYEFSRREEKLFSGIIKNKFELKRHLTQLEI